MNINLVIYYIKGYIFDVACHKKYKKCEEFIHSRFKLDISLFISRNLVFLAGKWLISFIFYTSFELWPCFITYS